MASRTTVDALMALMIPEIREMFLETIQGIVDDAILQDIISAIESDNPEAAFKAIGFTQAALYPIIEKIDEAFKRSGYATADSFPTYLNAPDGTKFVFRFDMRNPNVEQYLREHSSALVTRLTEEARDNVRTTLERGAIAGNNPRTTALDIVGRVDPVTKKRVGGIIGLTVNQEMWSSNTKRDLQNLDKKYFTRTLRDKRFDSLVKKAIESGKPLSDDTISKIVTSYNNRALKYRADVVSRTETLHAAQAAEWQAHKQLIETGAVKENDVKRHWDSSGDSRVRWSHSNMDKKYQKKGVGVDEPFISPSGARMMYPGDASLGASGNETIMCRCRVRIKVNWFGNL